MIKDSPKKADLTPWMRSTNKTIYQIYYSPEYIPDLNYIVDMYSNMAHYLDLYI